MIDDARLEILTDEELAKRPFDELVVGQAGGGRHVEQVLSRRGSTHSLTGDTAPRTSLAP